MGKVLSTANPNHVALDTGRLTDLVKAAALHRAHPDVLGDWEAAQLIDLKDRALDQRCAPVATQAEWDVAVAAMAALSQAAGGQRG